MPEVPECLNHRYQVLDQLINDLNSQISTQSSLVERPSNTSDVGIKLMCDFWNILKEDPDCNLTREIQNRMGVSTGRDSSRSVYNTQRYMTYMADRNNSRNTRRPINRSCCPEPRERYRQPIHASSFDTMPLSKALCDLKMAASLDKKCHERLNELSQTQKELMAQIQALEERERDQIKMLQEADCMWQCMEAEYKQKMANANEKQKELIKELKEVETNANKWKKNKKDLEFQILNMNKVKMEAKEKTNQKINDIKIIETEISNLQKRIEGCKKDEANFKKEMISKKEASDNRIAKIAANIDKVQKQNYAEISHRKKKEDEGTQYVKAARDDLQQLCKILLQKRLENEDLRAERKALVDEIGLLQNAHDTCKDRCKSKGKSIDDELAQLNIEISEFKAKCTKCHASVDTNDVRRLCTDCPKCLRERDCHYENDSCTTDPTMDCVCYSVKQKFLDNVFDNMYTVLERQSKTNPGKAVAEAILTNLKRSRNGKLSPETRQILQDFILTTVKKNLNLTIVGGAVKTRCEMDPETYKQLMLCLKEVKAVKPPKDDKGTAPRKDPCDRWQGTNECNCPKGPKDCICTKRAPPPPNDPKSCPQDKEDDGEQKLCPYKDQKVCGPDCGMQGKPLPDTSDVAAWRPNPCSGPSCTFSKNVRTTQCVLSTEKLGQMSNFDFYPDSLRFDKMVTCTCSGTPTKPCTCSGDTNQSKVIFEKNEDKKPCGTSLKKDIYNASDAKQKSNLRNVIKKEKYTSRIKNKLTKNKDLFSDIYKKSNYATESIVNFGDIENKPSEFLFRTIDNNGNEFDPELTYNHSKSGIVDMETNNHTYNLKGTKTTVIPRFLTQRQPNSQKRKVDNIENLLLKPLGIKIKDTLSDTPILEKPESYVNSIIEDKKNCTANFKATSCRTDHCNKFNGVIKNKEHECNKHKTTVPKMTLNNNVRTYKDKVILQNWQNKNVLLRNIGQKNNKTFLSKQIKCNENKIHSLVNSMAKQETRDSINILYNSRTCSDRLKSHLSEHINNSCLKKYCKKNKASSTSDGLIKDFTTEVDELNESTLQKSSQSFPNLILLGTPRGNKTLKNYSLELKQLYDQGNVIVKLQIQAQNGLYSKFSSIITRIPSGTIGIDLQKLKYLGDIPLDKTLLDHPVTLMKTISGTYLINSQNNEEYNAVLKTISSDKILLVPITPKYSALMFKEVGKLQDSNIKIHKGHLWESKISYQKAESDTKLYGSMGVKIKVGQTFQCHSSSMMKKTALGQYVFTLDKKFTKSLIENMRSRQSSHLEYPLIKNRTETDNNCLHLCNNLKDNENFTSLKITTLGNIDVTLDSETAKDMVELSNNDNQFNISNLNKSEHSCSPDCVTDICDHASKELQTDTVNLNSDVTSEVSSVRDSLTTAKEDGTPHIVIKPASENWPQKDMTIKECFYVFDTVCSYHRDRYSDVSNELLEITGLCNTMQDNSKQIEYKSDVDSHAHILSPVKWNSLNYLPPQLPPFLKNIIR